MKGSTNRMPIRKWIRPGRSASGEMASAGGGRTIAWDWCLSATASATTMRVSGLRRIGISAGRREAELWRGKIFSRAITRCMCGGESSPRSIAIYGPPGIQRGSRSGDCADLAAASGILGGRRGERSVCLRPVACGASARRARVLRTMPAKRRGQFADAIRLVQQHGFPGMSSLPTLRADGARQEYSARRFAE